MKIKRLKKASRHIPQEHIDAVIRSEGGSPQAYCILKSAGDSVGRSILIRVDGTLLDKLDGDEVFEYALVKYLETQNVPVFADYTELMQFQEELRLKRKQNDA